MDKEIRTLILKKGLCKVCGTFKEHEKILLPHVNKLLGEHYFARWECQGCQTRVKILKETRY